MGKITSKVDARQTDEDFIPKSPATEGTLSTLAGCVAGSELQVDIVAGGAGSGYIYDGVDSDIKATVLDYTNSNPLSVRLTDTNGDYVGAGAGTEYTEDAVSPADPIGKSIAMTRDDQLSTVTEAAGDWSRLRGTSKGALWVAFADASGDPIVSFGGGTEYTEDVATANPQVGKAIMMERDDILSAVTPVEGDWIGTRGTEEGALWVQDFNSDAILADTGSIDTNSGTIAGDTTSIDGKITACNTGAVVLAAGTALACDVGLTGNTVVDGSGSDLHTLIDAAGHLQIDVITAPTTAVTGTFWQETQPVSGTVTANLSATDNAVLDAIDSVLDEIKIDTEAIETAVEGTLTVDGTITANLSATDNTVLDNIDSNTDYGAVVGGGAEITALRVTIANDSTGVVSVDDGGGSLTIDNADITSTKTAVETIDNCIAGSEAQVDVVASLPAGTNNIGDVDIASALPAGSNAIGKLAANSGVDIGDVDILSIAAGTNVIGKARLVDSGGTEITETTDHSMNVTIVSDDVGIGGGTQYDEDAGHSTGDTGTMGLAVRHDTIASLCGTDLDYTPLQVDATGYLYTRISDGGGSITIDGDIGTVATLTGITNDVSIDDGGNTITVDGTITANLSATDNAVLDAIDTVLDQIKIDTEAIETAVEGTLTVDLGANNDVTVTSGDITETNSGAIKTAVELIDNAIDGTEMQVDVVASLPAGTNAIGKLAANSGVDIGDVDITSITGVTMSNAGMQITGDEAHDAVDAGNPIKTGGRSQEPTAQPDEVADNDRVDTLHDRVGRVATYQGYPRWYAAINCSTSGNNTIKAAAGAGKKIVVTSVAIISDGTTDIRWESGAGGSALSGQMPLQEREGYSASDPNGLFETAANALLNLELTAAVNVHGHIAGIIIND